MRSSWDVARTRHVAREGAWEQVPEAAPSCPSPAGPGSAPHTCALRRPAPAPPPRLPHPCSSHAPGGSRERAASGLWWRRQVSSVCGFKSMWSFQHLSGTVPIRLSSSHDLGDGLAGASWSWVQVSTPPAALPSLSGSRRSRLRNGDGTPPSMASRENSAAPDVGNSQQSEGS